MALPAGRAKVLGLQHDVSLTLELDPAVTVHETMKGLRALGQLVKVALQHLGEGVEHRPRIARFELRVVRRVPLINHLANLRACASTSAERLDDDIVRLGTGQPVIAVCVEAVLLQTPCVTQLADGAGHQLWQIAEDVNRMLAAQLNLAVEGKVIADKNIRTKRKRRWESFVVRITQPHDCTVILRLTGFTTSADAKQTEVPICIVSESMTFLKDSHIRTAQTIAN